MEDLHMTVHDCGWTAIYRKVHPANVWYTLLTSRHRMYTKTDYMLGSQGKNFSFSILKHMSLAEFPVDISGMEPKNGWYVLKDLQVISTPGFCTTGSHEVN